MLIIKYLKRKILDCSVIPDFWDRSRIFLNSWIRISFFRWDPDQYFFWGSDLVHLSPDPQPWSNLWSVQILIGSMWSEYRKIQWSLKRRESGKGNKCILFIDYSPWDVVQLYSTKHNEYYPIQILNNRWWSLN